MKFRNIKALIYAFILILFLLIFTFFPFRIDLTEDNRYSVSASTAILMQEFSGRIEINHYLQGDLNPGFQRLSRAVDAMVEDLDNLSAAEIVMHPIDPYEQDGEAFINDLILRGMSPTTVYLKEKDGKSVKKTIFPWIEILYQQKRVLVPLVLNNASKSGEENLNIAIENLEFELSDAFRRLLIEKPEKIAFIEGHGELPERAVFSISTLLSRYFQIDRGVIGRDFSALDPYRVVIIAGPDKPFTEAEKYILDQYLMRGGRIMWLIDGVYADREKLAREGSTPLIANNLNLDDLFFRYGIRLHNQLLMDTHCTLLPVNIAERGSVPAFESFPWVYAPLLITSPDHPVSRNLPDIKSALTSRIEIVNNKLNAEILLVNGGKAALLPVPSEIKLSDCRQTDFSLFKQYFFPVAVLMSGQFESAFTNRIAPPVENQHIERLNSGEFTRQLFIAGASVIANEDTGYASDSTSYPAGFDRYSGIRYGNEAFIVNAVNYLAGNEKWIGLRKQAFKIRLIDRELAQKRKTTWQMLNVVFPVVLLGFTGLLIFLYRKRKYRMPLK